MSVIFVGGSRKIARLPEAAVERLGNIVAAAHQVVVGDAPGADKAVQVLLAEAGYRQVTIFCSGRTCRNNVGGWPTRMVTSSSRGFQFFAAKDREMARAADFGLMIWDGKSPGTALNVLRLVNAGKKAVLLDASAGRTSTIRNRDDWERFIAAQSELFRTQLLDRATSDEWSPA